MRLALAILALAGVLSGCNLQHTGSDEVGDNLRIENIQMPDGREVECVVYQDHNEGGIDCDWDRAKEEKK